ncbi:hypothetical protein C8F01DRAFT_1113180 [Mycena amicta]|nr:hypothetical protein C8F01DRAFT_1113180 [Mycena amicta]
MLHLHLLLSLLLIARLSMPLSKPTSTAPHSSWMPPSTSIRRLVNSATPWAFRSAVVSSNPSRTSSRPKQTCVVQPVIAALAAAVYQEAIPAVTKGRVAMAATAIPTLADASVGSKMIATTSRQLNAPRSTIARSLAARWTSCSTAFSPRNNMPRAPRFPASLWKYVILNQFVDFDAIIANTFTAEPDQAQQIVIGDTGIELQKAKTVSKITTHAQWNSAFWQFYAAVTFAFPNRQNELQTYWNYVNSLFTAAHPGTHSRIIQFDRAARGEISQTPRLLYSDVSELAACKMAHLDPIGLHVFPEAQDRQARPPKTSDGERPRRREICRNFNHGRCSVSDCNRRHVCLECQASNHVAKDCPEKRST